MEPLGRRIAKLRADLGWTQQDLADRVAISRVALSHLESGLSTPGERTVALLAGVFDMEAHELVAGTTYPPAKVDRLPLVVARHTEVELQCRLLDRDIEIALRFRAPALLSGWAGRLDDLSGQVADPGQRSLVDAARLRLRSAADELSP